MKNLNLKISIYVVITFLVMGTLSFLQVKSIFYRHKKEKLELLNHQSQIVLDLRDNALNFTSQYMDLLAKNSIEEFIRYIEENNIDPTTIDLQQYIQENELGYRRNDFYIIDTSGKIVNTSFRHDLGMNVFSFGKKFEDHIRNIFKSGELQIDGFTIESKTHKLRKYAYKPTPDGKYIVEFGAYSEEATLLRNSVLSGIEDMLENDASILSIDIIPPALPDYYSLYNSGLILEEEEIKLIDGLYESSDTTHFDKKGKEFVYYKMFPRSGSELYNKLLIRIVSDASKEQDVLFEELQKEILLYAGGLVFLLTMIFISIRGVKKSLGK